MKNNVEEKIEREKPKKRQLDMYENDMWAVGVYVGMQKIERGGSLRQKWQTPKCLGEKRGKRKSYNN